MSSHSYATSARTWTVTDTPWYKKYRHNSRHSMPNHLVTLIWELVFQAGGLAIEIEVGLRSSINKIKSKIFIFPKL